MGTMVFLLSLLWVLRVIGQQRIIYVTHASTWADAQAHCREHHTDLVTITTDAENNQIDRDSWLGMYRENTSADWKWSKGDETVTYNLLSVDSEETWGNCVYKKDGVWKNDACRSRNSFFCLDDSLFLVKQMKTWEDALDHCRSLSSGNRRYDLATLLTMGDHDFVRSQISKQVWTGLRFLGDHWVWVGGEEVQYNDITTCPENERCGMVDKTTSQPYNTAKCEEKRNFFCYRKSHIYVEFCKNNAPL